MFKKAADIKSAAFFIDEVESFDIRFSQYSDHLSNETAFVAVSINQIKKSKRERIMAQETAHSNTTTDHDTIKDWVEARNGKPAKVKNTGSNGVDGILRIDFPGGDEDNLETMSWDDFFEEFEENDLAFLYQDETKDGETSRFNKFVERD